MGNEISLHEIARLLGQLEATLQGIQSQMQHSRGDLNTVFTRLRSAERSIAIGLGVAVTCSVVLPLVVTALAPRILLAQPQAQLPAPVLTQEQVH